MREDFAESSCAVNNVPLTYAPMKLPTVEVRSKEINHAECGKLIRAKREKLGMSLRRLAKEMGVTAPFLSDLELGRRNWKVERFNKAVEVLESKIM